MTVTGVLDDRNPGFPPITITLIGHPPERAPIGTFPEGTRLSLSRLKTIALAPESPSFDSVPGPFAGEDKAGEGIQWDRLLFTTGLGASILGGWLAYGFDKWWEDEKRPFHYTREGGLERDSYVGGMDKWGHLWGCLMIHRGISGMLRWCGFDKGWATLCGAVFVQGMFLFAEIEDAYYDYGWSDSDMLFNLLGSALAVALDLVPWLDDLVDFRLWYWPTPYLAKRDYNAAEDYSGQRYFLVFKGGGVPWVRETSLRFLEFYIGYEAPGYRRNREKLERHVFAGFSLDVMAVLDELVFQPTHLPPEARGMAGFVFEHWHPDMVHAPVVDAKLP